MTIFKDNKYTKWYYNIIEQHSEETLARKSKSMKEYWARRKAAAA